MKYIYPLFAILIVFFGCTSHQDEIIPDANLAAAIRKTLDLDPNTSIQKETLKQLKMLTAIRMNIKDLKGLENATVLTYLELSDNQIHDITPLAELTNLRHLSLNANQINDITPLTKLTALFRLYLEKNNISDITPLSELRHLKKLSLGHNKINDITPLAKLSRICQRYSLMTTSSVILPPSLN